MQLPSTTERRLAIVPELRDSRRKSFGFSRVVLLRHAPVTWTGVQPRVDWQRVSPSIGFPSSTSTPGYELACRSMHLQLGLGNEPLSLQVDQLRA